MSDAKVIEQIRKVLNLSARAGTAAEAATAAGIAARMMARHGIDSVDATEEEDPIGDNRDSSIYVGCGRSIERWKWNIAWIVAKHGRCKPLGPWHETTEDGRLLGCRISFVGRRSDALAAGVLLEYILRELKALHDDLRPRWPELRLLSVEARRSARRAFARDLRIWSADFYLGASHVIDQRMEAATRQVMATASSTALVKIERMSDRIDAFAAAMGITYVRATNDGRRSAAYDEGVRAGRTLDLRQRQGVRRLPSAGEQGDR